MIKGKIVLVPFPFDDLSSMKVRPAVCLTNPVGAHRHVVLAFITSQTPDALADSDLPLETTHPDFGLTGLRVSSTIRLHRLLTVTTAFVQRELGELTTGLQAEIDGKLRQLFQL